MIMVRLMNSRLEFLTRREVAFYQKVERRVCPPWRVPRRLIPASFVVLAFLSLAASAADFDTLLFDATRYANTSEKREAKASARVALKEQMPDAFRAAMDQVHGDNVGLQVLVMEWVFELPSEVIVPVLAEYIDHARADTRRMAIYFLGFHQAPELSDRVMNHLDEDKTRGVALRTLGKWKIAAARTAMEETLANGKERQRVVAANALRDLGDPAAIPALIAALDDPVFTVRNTAARALVTFGDETKRTLETVNDAPAVMVSRIRADLGEITVDEALDDSIVQLDGSFFLP